MSIYHLEGEPLQRSTRFFWGTKPLPKKCDIIPAKNVMVHFKWAKRKKGICVALLPYLWHLEVHSRSSLRKEESTRSLAVCRKWQFPFIQTFLKCTRYLFGSHNWLLPRSYQHQLCSVSGSEFYHRWETDTLTMCCKITVLWSSQYDHIAEVQSKDHTYHVTWE